MTENEIRNLVRKIIVETKEKNPSQINEAHTYMDSGEFYKIFLEPWKDPLEVAKLQTQVVLANVWTTFRVLTSFNGQKIARIKARHKDRVKALNDKTAQILDKQEFGDASALMFIANPAAYLAAGFVADPRKSEGIKNFFKEIGMGDFETGPEGEKETYATRQKRKEDERGPVRKALNALEQIFLLANYDPGENLLVEQGEEEDQQPGPSEAEIEAALANSPEGQELGELRKNIDNDYTDLLNFMKSLEIQINFLRTIPQAQDSEDLINKISQLENALNQLEQETDLSAFKNFGNAFKNDAETLAKNEEVRKIAADQILKDQGVEDPTEEDRKKVNAGEIDKRAAKLAWDQVKNELIGKVRAEVEEMKSQGKDLLDSFRVEGIEALNNNPIADKFEEAENIFNEL
tara:strand:- start:318 stop:1532 length:1215 start_codon:yes stop_codon:yes gene_type:complete